MMMVLRRTLSLLLGVLLCSTPAFAGPSIVVDADTGRVLEAEQATDPWFPASVTKLMTAYITLREIKTGRISMDTPFTVSPYAASMPASKIGLKAGLEVTVDNALKMLLVKSANDIAIVLAEGIGGSIGSFSERMNQEALRLGMRETSFVNPNGLPDPRHRTSARDMAILARALLLEFPEHEGLWGIGAIRLGNRTMHNTNGLVGRYPGIEGMKTGFICASGFNVVAAAKRGERRLIAVVMGSHTAAERTIKTAALLDKGFQALEWGPAQTLAELPTVDTVEPPDLRSQVCSGHALLADEDTDATSVAIPPSSDNPIQALVGQDAQAGANGLQHPVVLGPRARFQPVIVYAGRAPGSTVVARGPSIPGATAKAPASTRAYLPGLPLPLPRKPLPLKTNDVISDEALVFSPSELSNLKQQFAAPRTKKQSGKASSSFSKKPSVILEEEPSQPPLRP